MKKLLVIIICFCCSIVYGQNSSKKTLTLNDAINIACDSSLSAFKNKNLYMSAYWQYRNFKADMLPSLTWNITPIEFSRYLTMRYDSEDNIDIYREQKSYSTGTGLKLNQNFIPLGGSFYIETNLNYLKNFGDNTYEQYSGVPIMIGYSNQVLGYNSFKWDRRIEPLKYERNKIEYISNSEQVSIETMQYFFAAISAQMNYQSALFQLNNCDTLVAIAERKMKYLSVEKSDLLSLKADVLSAKNRLSQTIIALDKARSELFNFLRINDFNDIELVMPESPDSIEFDLNLAIEMAKKYSTSILEQQETILEKERQLDEINKTTRFNASVSASVGFNQVAENISGVYKDPLEQDLALISVQVPLLDWSKGKGKRNIAKNELEISKIEIEQRINKIEQDVINYIAEISTRREILINNYKVLDLAQEVYQQQIKKFQNGNLDVTSISMAQSKLETAQSDYLSSISEYWQCYYQLRKLTLYDFENKISLSEKFDFENL
ncbi:MAG: TolC family protein [Bacteroidales bacterium]|nr:TolC family protein [Bacteroidales bacterium]